MRVLALLSFYSWITTIQVFFFFSIMIFSYCTNVSLCLFVHSLFHSSFFSLFILDSVVTPLFVHMHIRRKEQEQLAALKQHHQEEIDHHKKEIERLQRDIDRHKGKIRKLKHDD